MGAFLRVVEGYVSIDWLHEVEGFQHFFRCGDVFQVFSAWVQWLQLEFYGILLDVYFLDDELQPQGDILGRLHDHIYHEFGFSSVFTGVDSHTASKSRKLLVKELRSLPHRVSLGL